MTNLKFLPIKYLPEISKQDWKIIKANSKYPKLVSAIYLAFISYPIIKWTPEIIIEYIFDNKSLQQHKDLEIYRYKLDYEDEEECWPIYRRYLIFRAMLDFTQIAKNPNFEFSGVKKWLTKEKKFADKLVKNIPSWWPINRNSKVNTSQDTSYN